MRLAIFLSFLFFSLSLSGQTLYRFKASGKIGYSDSFRDGKIVIQAIYEGGESYVSDRPYICVKDTRGWFYIDKEGNPMMTDRYDKMMHYSKEHPIRFVKNGKYGLMRSDLSILAEAQYVQVDAYDNSNEFARAIKGTCNSTIGGEGCLEALLDVNGVPLANTWFERIFGFYEGLAVAKREGKTGVINKLGSTVIPFQFDGSDFRFYEGLLWVKSGNCLLPNGCKYGFLNAKGEEVIKLQFSDVEHFSQGLAPAQLGDSWGFIDKSGGWVIRPQYDSAKSFGQLGAVVRLKGKYGAIDKQGKVIIPMKYDYMEQQSGSRPNWTVKEAGKFFKLNAKGERIDN